MPSSSSNAVPACNETIAVRIGRLAYEMEQLGLKADAAILRGLMRSLPDQLPPGMAAQKHRTDTSGLFDLRGDQCA